MAMGFYHAGRPQVPDYATAEMQQTAIANQLRAQEQAQNLGAGFQLAQFAPEGSWAALGNSLTPGMVGGGANVATPVATDLATGAMASMTPEAAALAGAGTEAAAGAGAGAAGGGSGFLSALGSLGPMGWAALAAIGLGLAAQ